MMDLGMYCMVGSYNLEAAKRDGIVTEIEDNKRTPLACCLPLTSYC